MPSGSRILIIEDNAELRFDLEEFLNLEGYQVSTAADGVEALTLLARHPVEAIVSDYEMPNMDGYRLLQSLRAQEETANLPFVLISGKTPPPVDNDPDFHFLKKPFAIEDLISTLEQLICP